MTASYALKLWAGMQNMAKLAALLTLLAQRHYTSLCQKRMYR
jgi:hypothetical protein